ncbi:MAG: Hsp20/alpha crystallin family protein [Candidatus Dormibacteraeota bacterium]|nr:Hsp20/alpha crystallin family protein [Candidatus Dormibacteraeota bacterium]
MSDWRYDLTPSPLMREMLRSLEPQWRQPTTGGEPMPINIYEDDAAFVVEAALPGVRADEVDVSASENVLTIRGRLDVAEREYLHQELHTTDLVRQVALPGDAKAERAEASLENGVLLVRVPKATQRPPEKIRIQVNRREPGPTIEARKGDGYTDG